MVKTTYNQQPLDVKFDVKLDYRISDSFTFNIMLSNFNNYLYQSPLRKSYFSE